VHPDDRHSTLGHWPEGEFNAFALVLNKALWKNLNPAS
jgi:hypothetical protein